MERVEQLIKRLKFDGYSNEEILKMVKKCLEMEFDYSK